jgi:hypothetical protein
MYLKQSKKGTPVTQSRKQIAASQINRANSKHGQQTEKIPLSHTLYNQKDRSGSALGNSGSNFNKPNPEYYKQSHPSGKDPKANTIFDGGKRHTSKFQASSTNLNPHLNKSITQKKTSIQPAPKAEFDYER